MSSSIVNAKVDSYTKERVDAVLKREQKTTSEVIRIIWNDIARTGELPEIIHKVSASEQAARQRQRLAALHRAIGVSDLSSAEVNRDARDLLAEELMRHHG